MSYTLNLEAVRKSLFVTNKQMNGLSQGNAKRKFNASHRELLEDFDDHEVTQELNEGAGAENITKSLPDGNLYGFIGFEENPIPKLREVIDSSVKIDTKSFTTSIRGNTFNYKFDVEVPTKTQLEEASPMPDWPTSGSWTTKIEKVISGLEYYLYKAAGRSRAGIQIKKSKVRNDRFSGIDYLTGIFNKFKNRLR